jgi:protein O-GlcNAc transferase
MGTIQGDLETQPFIGQLLSAMSQEDLDLALAGPWSMKISEEARICMLNHGHAISKLASCEDRSILETLKRGEEQEVIQAARQLLSERQFKPAEQLLTLAILSASEAGGLVAELARAYDQCHQPEKSLQAYRMLADLLPYAWELRFQQARELRNLGRSDEAIEAILPNLIFEPSLALKRLYGALLSDMGAHADAISAWQSVLQDDPDDHETARILANKFIQIADFDRALNLLISIKGKVHKDIDTINESLIFRHLGELETSICLVQQLIESGAATKDSLWIQSFNYGMSGRKHADDLMRCSKDLWTIHRTESQQGKREKSASRHRKDERTRVGILSADIGNHVVSRFIKPILRSYDRQAIEIEIICTRRRYDELAEDFKRLCSHIFSLQGLSRNEAQDLLVSRDYDVIIETGGLTNNSGLSLLSERCAPHQCHYIGYHATTGLDTIDFFIGDQITCALDLQEQFSEKILQVAIPWISYDPEIVFPNAYTTSKRKGPVLGCFCQTSKIGKETLDFWSEALRAIPDAVIVIKDRGTVSQRFRTRVEEYLKAQGIESSRLFYVGPVATHLEHLSCYNAIDIALDTTPWSSATTAFETLGMGVPLVSIYGDTTSGRMSASVATAAGMPDLIARSPQEFGRITSRLAEDYEDIRRSKPYLQRSIRASCLFDDRRAGENFNQAIHLITSKMSPI